MIFEPSSVANAMEVDRTYGSLAHRLHLEVQRQSLLLFCLSPQHRPWYDSSKPARLSTGVTCSIVKHMV